MIDPMTKIWALPTEEMQVSREVRLKNTPDAPQFEPTADRVLLRQEKADERTPGGLIKPQRAQVPTRAKVLAVGPGYLLNDGTLRPLYVEAGDIVAIPAKAHPQQFADKEIELEGHTLLLLQEKEILGIIQRGGETRVEYDGDAPPPADEPNPSP